MSLVLKRMVRTCLLAVSTSVAGCGKNDGAPPQVKYTIGFSQTTDREPWRVLFNNRLQEAAGQKPEVKLIVLDADDRTEQQVAQMRDLVRQKVDAILVSPKEAPGLTLPVEEAAAAGIPVIVLDRDVDTNQYTSFVGGDNHQIGRAAGSIAVRLLGGAGRARGNVYEICGGLSSSPAKERRDGFHEVVEKEPGIRIAGGLDADWKQDKAQAVMQEALRSPDPIDLIYAHNDPMAYGAYLAAKEAGRENGMKFIGIDAMENKGRQWVREGVLTATLLYPTPGEKGLEVAMDVLAGKPVQKRYILPTRVYTKENIDRGGDPVDPIATTPVDAPGRPRTTPHT